MRKTIFLILEEYDSAVSENQHSDAGYQFSLNAGHPDVRLLERWHVLVTCIFFKLIFYRSIHDISNIILDYKLCHLSCDFKWLLSSFSLPLMKLNKKERIKEEKGGQERIEGKVQQYNVRGARQE